MAFTIKELEDLRKKLDRDRRELEERERALAKVEQMLREQMSAAQPSLPIPESVPMPDGLTDAVTIAVAAHDGVEFTVPDIEDYLRNQSFELPKEPRSRISMVLQSLAKRGVINRTYEGKGREPHRYQIQRTMNG